MTARVRIVGSHASAILLLGDDRSAEIGPLRRILVPGAPLTRESDATATPRRWSMPL